MSDFLAEARVIVRPDTTRFRAELVTAVTQATSKPISVPVQATFVGSGQGAATVTAAQRDLAAATTTANESLALQNLLVGRGAVILEAEAIAAQEDAVAQQKLGAARALQASNTKALAAVQTSAAASAAKLAHSQEVVAGAASQVGAAQVTLTRSTAAVAAAERTLAVALAAKNIALIDAASQSLRLAEAQALEAETALAAARAQAVHAATLGAVQKAAFASTAATLGLRGAVLTAGTAFLAATVGFEAVKKSIQGASDLNEEFNKTIEVFTSSAPEILEWSTTTARGLGIARVEALRAIGTFGELFRTLGVGPDRAGELSQTLVQLSADLASFFNADPTQVLKALQSGLVGQARPLRQFGIFLTEARVKQEALIETGKDNIESLTQQDRILARYNLILQDSAIASGDFERTQGNLANQGRILKAELSDLSDEVGELLVPAVLKAVQGTNEWVKSMRDLITVAKVTGGSLKSLLGTVTPLGAAVEKTGISFDGLAAKATKLYFRTVLLGPTLTAASIAVDKLDLSSERAAPQIAELTESLAAFDREAQRAAIGRQTPQGDQGLGVQQILNRIEGFDAAETRARISGDTAEILAVLDAEQKFLIAQLERQAVRNRPALRRSLERALLGATNDIATIQKQGAAAAKSAAADAKRAQQEADQELLALLANRRDDVERAGEQAEAEGNLTRAIRFEDRLQALIKQQIQKIRAQIADEKARAAAVRQLRIALIASRREEDELRQERAEEAAARRSEAINLDIDFAETIGNVDREIAARQRLIALLRKQQATVKKGSNEWKRLRNAIAEQQEAIKEARDQADSDDGKDAQRFFFEQLQAQQGFAANLLGNLIPADMTAGLVGVPSPASTGPGKGIATAQLQAEGKAAGGPTAGQASTTNEILLRILRQLQTLNGTHDAPEAIYQRKNQAGSGDFASM